MKVAFLVGVSAFCLASCHATRDKHPLPVDQTTAATSQTSKADKSIEKSRNAMLDKKVNMQSEHWPSSPAAASTAATPAPASSQGKPSPDEPSPPPESKSH